MNTEQAKARAQILKALAHPTRVLMLNALSRGDRCVNDLRSLASVSQPTISHHLEKLKKVGIVTEKRQGKKVIHHLSCPCMLEAVDCTLGVIQSVKKRQGQTL
jgi:DNA-binding transcriptional ArsR family regulator